MTESVQKWLERNRPPRVKITYDVHTGGAIEKRELPFIVGVFADLSGDRDAQAKVKFPPVKGRRMLPIDRDNFNDVMAAAQPRVDLGKFSETARTNGTAGEDVKGQLVFRSLDDFAPVKVVQAISSLRWKYSKRGYLRLLQSRAEAIDTLAEHLDTLVAPGPEAKAQRDKLQVLARPAGALPADIAADKQGLFALAAFLATKPVADHEAELKKWGPDLSAARAKSMLGLFTVDDADDVVHRAKDQLALLAKPADATSPEAKAALEKLTLVFGTPVDPVPSLAGDLKTRLEAAGPLSDEVKLAARVLLGLQEPDEENDTDPVDTDSTTRAKAESRHACANRWFATNLLRQVRSSRPLEAVQAKGEVVGKPAVEAVPASASGITPVVAARDAVAEVKASPAIAARDAVQAGPALANIVAVEDLFKAAGSLTDSEQLNLLAAFGHFALQVLKPMNADGVMVKPSRHATVIDARISEIDAELSAQLSAVMHWPRFREMEATWRGLHYLVSRTETSTMLKLCVFNATQAELLDDLEKAVDKDQSHLFKMIYEAEYGTYGGFPFSLLVGGYEIGRSPIDIEFLHKISEVAAAAHAPYITAASASLFGLKSFRDLDRPRDLAKIFEGADLAGWQEFRATEDSRYVSLVLPHALLRLPYGKDTWPAEGLNFEEGVGGKNQPPNAEQFLWGNAAYMLAERITHAFSLYNWTAAIRGVEGGGLVEGLPLYIYPNDTGTKTLFCPTEVSITDRREKELNDLGFISLVHCKGKGKAAFFGGQTTNLAKKYITNEANANARISAMLPYMLAASRFAHYIKVIMRDKVGSFLNRANVETFLNAWISQYVLLDENAYQEAKASFPLSQANIIVTDVPGQPGCYNAVVFLRPHFQLEELTTSIRLVANLPAA